jgi:hypothetical protein
MRHRIIQIIAVLILVAAFLIVAGTGVYTAIH